MSIEEAGANVTTIATPPDTSVITLTAEETALVTEGTGRIAEGPDERFDDPGLRAAARSTILECWHGLPDLADRVSETIDREPYFALIRGVPLASPSAFFVALASSWGEIAEPYQRSWSRAVHHIRPRSDRVIAGSGVLNQYLHTDGTHWPRPNDLTCLLCLCADQRGGGRSRLLSLDRLRAGLNAAHPGVLDVLTAEAVPWALDENLGAGVDLAPVFTDDRVRWLKHTIDQATGAGATLPDPVADALRTLESFVERCPGTFEFPLGPGDLLVVNNRRCMHARTPIPNPASSRRHLARIKVNR